MLVSAQDSRARLGYVSAGSRSLRHRRSDGETRCVLPIDVSDDDWATSRTDVPTQSMSRTRETACAGNGRGQEWRTASASLSVKRSSSTSRCRVRPSAGSSGDGVHLTVVAAPGMKAERDAAPDHPPGACPILRTHRAPRVIGHRKSSGTASHRAPQVIGHRPAPVRLDASAQRPALVTSLIPAIEGSSPQRRAAPPLAQVSRETRAGSAPAKCLTVTDARPAAGEPRDPRAPLVVGRSRVVAADRDEWLDTEPAALLDGRRSDGAAVGPMRLQPSGLPACPRRREGFWFLWRVTRILRSDRTRAELPSAVHGDDVPLTQRQDRARTDR